MKKLTFAGIALMMTAVLSWAQTPVSGGEAPSEVDQALRARVNKFFQAMVDNDFLGIFDMVADDTKKEYFNMGKAPLNWFKVDAISYSDDFTRALVKTTSEKNMVVETQTLKVQVPSSTTWKIEKGQWVWYDNPATVQLIDPSSVPNKPADSPQTGAGGPPLTDADLVTAFRNSMSPASLDKNEVSLSANLASQASVVFHNGTNGAAQLRLSSPEVSGLTAKLDKSNANVLEDVRISLAFDPSKGKVPSDPIDVQVTSLPSNQVFNIRVTFTK